MFTVKLPNFLMFTVFKENTVKCLEGISDVFGNGRTSSLVFGNLRQSSEISSNNPDFNVKWPRVLDILNKIISVFLEPFLLLSGKKLLFQRIFYC